MEVVARVTSNKHPQTEQHSPTQLMLLYLLDATQMRICLGYVYVCVCVGEGGGGGLHATVKKSYIPSLVPSLIPSFYRLQLIFMNSKKAGGGLGTRLLHTIIFQPGHIPLELVAVIRTHFPH